MEILQVIILSVIEGITEFLPISSTGHLIVFSKLIGLSQSAVHKNFEITIQLASMLAVAYEYRSKIYNNISLWKKIMLSFIPVGIVGLLFHKLIYSLFSVYVVGIMFIIGGIIFLIVEKYYVEKEHQTKKLEDITYKQSFLVGLCQVLALIPGTSRSGATIIGGLLAGLNRKVSTEFSFLIALPVMFVATIFDIFKNINNINFNEGFNLLLGFIISFFVALITIKYFIKYVEKNNFVIFGIYRIIFGILLLWFFN